MAVQGWRVATRRPEEVTIDERPQSRTKLPSIYDLLNDRDDPYRGRASGSGNPAHVVRASTLSTQPVFEMPIRHFIDARRPSSPIWSARETSPAGIDTPTDMSRDASRSGSSEDGLTNARQRKNEHAQDNRGSHGMALINLEWVLIKVYGIQGTAADKQSRNNAQGSGLEFTKDFLLIQLSILFTYYGSKMRDQAEREGKLDDWIEENRYICELLSRLLHHTEHDEDSGERATRKKQRTTNSKETMANTWNRLAQHTGLDLPNCRPSSAGENEK